MRDAVAPEHFVDWNEQMVKRFDQDLFHHHPRGAVRWVEQRREKAIIHLLNLRPNSVVLDAGWIELSRRWARTLGLDHLLLGNFKSPPCAPVFNVDYHLHRFSLKRLREVVGEKLYEVELIRVPAFYPVHWVMAYDR